MKRRGWEEGEGVESPRGVAEIDCGEPVEENAWERRGPARGAAGPARRPTTDDDDDDRRPTTTTDDDDRRRRRRRPTTDAEPHVDSLVSTLPPPLAPPPLTHPSLPTIYTV